jgi:hypothetical protein
LGLNVASFSSARFFVAGLIQSSFSIVSRIAASRFLTSSCMRASAAGGKYLSVYFLPSASPKSWSVASTLFDRDRDRHELHDSIEQPGRKRAHSGRFAANRSRPGCSSYGRRNTSSSSGSAARSPRSVASMTSCTR